MASLKKSTWTTYDTTGYIYDVANDQASAGGVHEHQVRKVKAGWQGRILQSNGWHEAAGPVSAISAEDGEAHWATIIEQEEKMERARAQRRSRMSR